MAFLSFSPPPSSAALSRLLHLLPRPSQPHVFFPSAAVFILAYYTISPAYAAPKQKAWVLTALSSLCMTLCSLPYVFHYVAGGLSVHAIPAGLPLALCANSIFQAYLIVDLIIGALHYRTHVNLLSGWVHHSLYIFVNELALRRSWAHIFALCSIMELPTFILALGTLHPALRSDVLFALAFFGTRIALHLRVLAAYAGSATRHALLGGSVLPAAVLALALGMHALWFVQCVRGNVRRWTRSRRRRSALAAAATAGERGRGGAAGEAGEARTSGEAKTAVDVTVVDPRTLEVVVEPAPASSSLPELSRPAPTTGRTDNERIFGCEAGAPGVTRRTSQMCASAGSPSPARSAPRPPPSPSPITCGTSSTRPVGPPRVPSVERALQTLARLRAQAQHAARTDRRLARVRGLYDRLPGRKVLCAYVGLDAPNGPGGMRDRERELELELELEGARPKMVGVY